MLLALDVDGCVSCQQDVLGRNHGKSLRLIVFEDGGQRFHDVLGIIVEEDDVALLHVRGCPLDQVIRAAVLPIQGVHGPLHTLIAFIPHDGYDLAVIVSLGRAEQRGANAGEGFDLVRAAVQLLADLAVGYLSEMGVGI